MPRYRAESLLAEPLPGLPSPQLTFTGRFRADKASEALAARLALLTARRRPTWSVTARPARPVIRLVAA